MKRLLFILPLFSSGLCQAQAPDTTKPPKQFSHRFSLSALYLHVSDPDWSHMWWRRGWVPSYELGYKGWAAKVRFSTLQGIALGPFAPRWDRQSGKSYESNLDDEFQVDSNWNRPGFVSERQYYTTDLVLSRRLPFTRNHAIKVGLGASYRKGSEIVTLFQIQHGYWNELFSEVVERNQWGGIGEVSYSYTFFKRFFVQAEASYRVYPKSTSLFTGGLGIGVQFEH